MCKKEIRILLVITVQYDNSVALYCSFFIRSLFFNPPVLAFISMAGPLRHDPRPPGWWAGRMCLGSGQLGGLQQPDLGQPQRRRADQGWNLLADGIPGSLEAEPLQRAAAQASGAGAAAGAAEEERLHSQRDLRGSDESEGVPQSAAEKSGSSGEMLENSPMVGRYSWGYFFSVMSDWHVYILSCIFGGGFLGKCVQKILSRNGWTQHCSMIHMQVNMISWLFWERSCCNGPKRNLPGLPGVFVRDRGHAANSVLGLGAKKKKKLFISIHFFTFVYYLLFLYRLDFKIDLQIKKR